MHALIKEKLLKQLGNPILNRLTDGAYLPGKGTTVFTTDSFVVSPLFFAGGDIGKLAVCGTVNDLVVMGARPEYLSLGLIIEEGLEIKILEKIIDSIALAVRNARLKVVTGDLKVVEKLACDKIFINTSGLGSLIAKRLEINNISAGDKVIITGGIAEHGLAVLAKRKDLGFGFNIKSDCNALDSLILPLLKKYDGIKFMRDPTRGGLSTTLNEIAGSRKLGIVVDEKNIPVSSRVRAACELLGIDPLYMANEGKAVMIVEKGTAQKIIGRLRKHPLGRQAGIIGEVTKAPAGRVVLRTILGSERFIDMLSAEVLPRIC